VEKISRKAGLQAEAAVMRAAGHSHEAIAKHLKVTVRTVERWQAKGILDEPDTNPPEME
jgi:transposase